LKTEVTTRLKAQAKKAETLQTVAAMSEVKTTEGLSSHEIAALITIMADRSMPDSAIAPHEIKNTMRRSGYTSIAVSLALESLSRKAMIEYFDETDFNGNRYTQCRLTMKGLDWMLVNQGRFRMRKNEEPPDAPEETSGAITDEDIPF
jgi:hypothetical protein